MSTQTDRSGQPITPTVPIAPSPAPLPDGTPATAATGSGSVQGTIRGGYFIKDKRE
jgi:hypothetical protein